MQTAGVSELSATVSPLEAVATTANGATGRVTSGSAPKVIVCDAFAMLKLWIADAEA